MSNPRYSIFAASAVFDERLGANDVRVLAALGTYADNQGWCFPNQGTLAEKIGCTRQTIAAAMGRLVDCGYVEKQTRTTRGRGKVGYNYRVVIDAENRVSDDVGKADVKKTNIIEADVKKTADVKKLNIGPMLNPLNIAIEERSQSFFVSKDTQKDILSDKQKSALKISDARKLWAELRPSLSAEGRTRGKPAQIDKALAPILKRHGYEATLRAAKQFYSETPDCKRNNGEGQPGLQVICNDGRLEALIEQRTEETREKTPEEKWAVPYAHFDGGGKWYAEDWGPAPYQPGHKGPRKHKPALKGHSERVAA